MCLMKNNISILKLYDSDFSFSFTKSLYTSLRYAGYEVSPMQIAAKSGFAFRIWVAKSLCPSAMSIFDWELLKKGVEQCGFEVTHITRLWDEEHLEVERREQAHLAIKKAVDDGIPAIVWDVSIPEWELITGYDDERQEYSGLSITGQLTVLPYDKLGRREIPILSVTIPGKTIELNETELLKSTLQMAVAHAHQNEWEDRPEYQDGLLAYKVWSQAMGNVTTDDWPSRYYIQTYECMRRYAAEYLLSLAKDIKGLEVAAQYYQNVHNYLSELLSMRNDSSFPNPILIAQMQELILKAGDAEEQGITAIEEYLKTI
jgi:hypothetical protein